MITFTLKGSFEKSEKFFDGAKNKLPDRIKEILNTYGQKGVEALQNSTPTDSGETSKSWYYEVTKYGISWHNSNLISTGVPLAILLQYGHGTRNGGYVQGIDYINPALRPIFNEIAESCWKEVQNL